MSFEWAWPQYGWKLERGECLRGHGENELIVSLSQKLKMSGGEVEREDDQDIQIQEEPNNVFMPIHAYFQKAFRNPSKKTQKFETPLEIHPKTNPKNSERLQKFCGDNEVPRGESPRGHAENELMSMGGQYVRTCNGK